MFFGGSNGYGRTERQMDGQTDGHAESSIPPPTTLGRSLIRVVIMTM
jgi:hypothetical protein